MKRHLILSMLRDVLWVVIIGGGIACLFAALGWAS